MQPNNAALRAGNERLRASLKAARRRIPRCREATESGYRCAQGVGHSGPHTHPNEGRVSVRCRSRGRLPGGEAA